MKVLFVDVNYKQGSTGKIVQVLSDFLVKEGHQSFVCFGRGLKSNENNVAKISNYFEVYLHAGLSLLTGYDGIYSCFSTFKLLKYIDAFKPDVVHLHDVHGYYINYFNVIKYLKEKKIRTVFTLHSEFPYTGKCGISLDCDKWQSECNKCPKLKEYPPSLFFDFSREMFTKKKSIYNNFSNIKMIAPSRWLLKRAQLSIMREITGDVIFNGVEARDMFFPRDTVSIKNKYGLNSDKIVLAVAPNIMSDFKGGRFIIDMADKLAENNIFFILVGVNDLNIAKSKNVLLLSKTDNQTELAELYSIANLHVICSKTETFSMTCAESICCGTPVVGFMAGGPESVFIDPFAKFVPYGDTNRLAQLILDSINIKDQLKDKCVEYGRSNFAKEIMCQKYLDLYLNYDSII